MANNLDKFIENLTKISGDNLLSVIAYGSQAHTEFKSRCVNLNLMIVLNNLDASLLHELSKPVYNWIKSGNPLPVIMNKDEWFSSFDVYAMEYSDMVINSRIIYGENLINTIEIDKFNLRLQCESELKSLLLSYKNAYLVCFDSDKEMQKVFASMIKSLLVIFRSVLRLYDTEVPYRAVDIINKVSEYIKFDKEVLLKIAQVRYENDKYTKQDMKMLKGALLDNMQHLLKQVDAIKM